MIAGRGERPIFSKRANNVHPVRPIRCLLRTYLHQRLLLLIFRVVLTSKGLWQLLRDVAKESGIPFNTLRNWWQEAKKSCTEDGTTEATKENNSENTKDKESPRGHEQICKSCGVNQVYLIPDTNNPVQAREIHHSPRLGA